MTSRMRTEPPVHIPPELLEKIKNSRVRISKATEATHKARLGQFLTPESTANYMAGMFTNGSNKNCRLLDAGAGIGSLSSSFLHLCAEGRFGFQSYYLMAF